MTTNNKEIIAVCYARISTEDQSERSIEAQLNASKDLAEDLGATRIVNFKDIGISGKTDKRPDFQKAINFAIHNKAKFFVVHKLDRFSRNRMDSIKYRNILRTYGVKLYSVIEKLTGEPEDILLESVYDGLAEYYSANLGREVIKVLKENALNAKFNGGTPPLGYDIDDNKNYIINESEAIIVKKIFDMILEGMTYGEIIKEFNKRGYKTKNNNSFGKNSLHSILRNERYKGTYVYNKTMNRNQDGTRNRHKQKPEKDIIRINNAIPKIISTEEFDEVQKILDSRKINGSSSKAKEIYLLQGIIYCGECGSPMHGNRRKNGSGQYYISYRCSRQNQKLQCDNKEIRREDIEKYIINILEKNLFSKNNIKRFVNKVNRSIEKMENKKNENSKTLSKELKIVESKINNILSAIEEGNNSQILFTRLNNLELEKNRIDNELTLKNSTKYNHKVTKEDIEKAFSSYMMNIKKEDREKIKEIIRRFVKKIIISKGRIEVRFNTTFSFTNISINLLDKIDINRKSLNII